MDFSFAHHRLYKASQIVSPVFVSWVCGSLLALTMETASAATEATEATGAADDASQVGSRSARALDFNRDVRPILSDKCFRCHGPDSANQRSSFRIDSFENATAVVNGGAGVAPGHLKESEVHWRIHSDDPDDVMPPPEAKMPLSAEEIAILDRWIEEGAVYAPHWSFVPIAEAVPVPEVATSDWARHEIDRFVLARLEEEGVEPAPSAKPEQWLRRVTLDLTGLPPTPNEIDAFLADPSEAAREAVVERLFETEAYAERMTAEWLDVARYSDTYGFQVDHDREVWPWRDWVVSAFSKNLPYDQFAIWQLAGDLLPEPTREQRLATAFNRLHPQEAEGGSVPEEYRVESMADRVQTYGTAFLGLSFECSRCHDHKYDPLTAMDYYRAAAFFDKIDEAGLYSFFTRSAPTPALWLPSDDQEAELARLDGEVTAQEEALAALAASEEAHAAFETWLAGEGASASPPDPVAAYDFDRLEDSGFPSLVEGVESAKNSPRNQLAPGRRGQAVHLTGDDAVTLPLGDFTQDEPFSISLWMKTPDHKERAVIFSRSKAWSDAASRGYELLLEDGRLSAALIHFYPGDALRVRAKEPLPTGEWKHVVLSYDGSRRAAGTRLYLDGESLELEIVRDKLTREITGGGSDTIVIGERMRDSGFKDGLVDDFQVFDRELSPAEVALLAEAGEDVSFEPDLAHYLRERHEGYAEALAALRETRKARSALVTGIREIMTMEEMREPRQTHLLEAGHYENRGEPVEPGTPAFLPPMAEGEPRNRLGLARWTVDPGNPLTARVTVNRYWQLFFGRGLVPSAEEFGSQGEWPSHPELLDWLARDFVEHGWDLRRLFRQIALSATYGQDSRVPSGEIARRDPENLLLYRYPSPRLPAETLRDSALAASGLLVRQVGGPPVRPYDIALSFKPMERGKGEALYRRSLYTYWKRTAPSPLMTVLDASKREVCQVRLEITDSPLQGLVLFNSEQFVEAARVLATDLVERHGNDEAALVEEAYLRLVSRRPLPEEREVLGTLLAEQSALFAGDVEGARAYLSTGDLPVPETEDPTRLAAVTAMVSTLMNFDEFSRKR